MNHAAVMARLLGAAMQIRRPLPDAFARAMGRAAGAAAWAAWPGRRRAVADSITRLLPTASPADRARLCRSTFRNFGACAADWLHAPYKTGPQVLAMAALMGTDQLTAALARGKGAILVSPHVGNWDLAAVGVAALGLPAHGIAESIDPARDAVMTRIRGASGLRIIPLGPAAADAALAVLERNELLVIVGDRAMGARAVVTEFCGGQREIPVGPAMLALSTGAPIFTGYAVLAPAGAPRPYVAVIEPAVPVEGLGRRPIEALTQRLAARLAAIVRHYPDQWFVFQPEWQSPPAPTSSS